MKKQGSPSELADLALKAVHKARKVFEGRDIGYYNDVERVVLAAQAMAQALELYSGKEYTVGVSKAAPEGWGRVNVDEGETAKEALAKWNGETR